MFDRSSAIGAILVLAVMGDIICPAGFVYCFPVFLTLGFATGVNFVAIVEEYIANMDCLGGDRFVF